MAISQLDQATQENAASSEETASTSEELNAQTETLASVVADLTLVIKGRNEQGRAPAHQAAKAKTHPTKHHHTPLPHTGSSTMSGNHQTGSQPAQRSGKLVQMDQYKARDQAQTPHLQQGEQAAGSETQIPTATAANASHHPTGDQEDGWDQL
jgi:hypothetical protein